MIYSYIRGLLYKICLWQGMYYNIKLDDRMPYKYDRVLDINILLNKPIKRMDIDSYKDRTLRQDEFLILSKSMQNEIIIYNLFQSLKPSNTYKFKSGNIYIDTLEDISSWYRLEYLNLLRNLLKERERTTTQNITKQKVGKKNDI